MKNAKKLRVMTMSFVITLVIALTASQMPIVAFAASPEWAIDNGAKGESTRSDSLSASFDMRDKGWVTPVKLQNPWGTCWAFGAIAATESSILSSTGRTYADTGLDLSEHHLSWFAVHHITDAEDPAQAGEGC